MIEPNLMDDNENRLIEEMKALIRFCEVTDNNELRTIVKQRLRFLSGIDGDNIWSLDNINLDEQEEVINRSYLFTSLQLEMIRFYFDNPNQTLNNIGLKFGIKENVSTYFISRFFKLTTSERKLILNKKSEIS